MPCALLCRALNHFTHDLGHQWLSLVGSLLNLLVAYLNRIVEATKVGDNADTEGLDATVVGNDDLRNGRHTHGIATQRTIHPIFCWCLEGRACSAYIDTINQTDILLLGNLGSQIDELVVVGLVHVWETGTCREVLTTQRMLREEVDMVGDNHQVANLEGGIHTTSGIRDKERLNAQLVHHTNGEGDFLHVIALVVVKTALHGHDVYTTELAKDEGTSMSFYGRNGEIGYLTIGKLEFISYFGS